ncbi:MAG: hypothetical protein KIS79_06030 [Burkholderiales bacterium]|nr:hypothetical protein [Burkholderiales bacterium]
MNCETDPGTGLTTTAVAEMVDALEVAQSSLSQAMAICALVMTRIDGKDGSASDALYGTVALLENVTEKLGQLASQLKAGAFTPDATDSSPEEVR